ncbi:MAG: hypothetical protein V3R27_10485 [Pseudomonadales bacterium]
MPVARIQSITERWAQIIRLELEEPFQFAAGQYLEIEHPSGTRIPLSIASAPHRLPRLELHYRSTPGDDLAALLDGLLQKGRTLDLCGPFGDVIVTTLEAVSKRDRFWGAHGRATIFRRTMGGFRRKPWSKNARTAFLRPLIESPLMLVAGGTGISQALSIIEHIDQLLSPPAVTLLWCVDTAEALYARGQLAGLSWLSANYLVDDRRTSDNEGLVWLSEHLRTHAYARTLLCGGPSFVYAVVDHLRAEQRMTALESDVFAYSPKG